MSTDSSLRPVIMGILNVTPDSFSDGGKYQAVETAVQHALAMVEEGADMIDVGGESTRPGSCRVAADEQIRRVNDTIRQLRETLPASTMISIDTTLCEVARRALEAGANCINDVSAGRDDPSIMDLAADTDCPYVIMHMQGTPDTMQDKPSYDDVVEEIRTFLLGRAQVAESRGIRTGNIIIDPGIGFGKTTEHNLALMAHLGRFVETGYPVLLGTSRKRFMGAVCRDAAPNDLIGATVATTTIGVESGVRYFRVHDVRENRQAVDVAWAIKNQVG